MATGRGPVPRPAPATNAAAAARSGGFANRSWVELMDQRFGWTSDFPMFQRKFGWYAEESAEEELRYLFGVFQR